MKALRLHARGGPEQLVYEDAPLPIPAAGEVRVRVYAAGLTPTELRWDQTYQTRDGQDRTPSIPGHDVSGVVDAIGAGVTTLTTGDAVYGLIDFDRDGSAAEYATIPAADLAPKPQSIDHIQASAAPLSALSAWQALFDHGKLAPGMRVLIHGAAGGVGAYAVQLARYREIQVFATCSAQHAAFVRSLGANAVIDYHAVRFETIAHNVNVVLDLVGGETRQRSWQTLAPGGVLVSLYSPIENDPNRRKDVSGVFFIVRPNRDQLITIGKLIDEGKLRVFLEETFPLSEGRRAFERAIAGHLKGKLVLQVVG